MLGNPIRGVADVDRLLELESIEPLGFVIETVRKTRAGLSESLPLIGFAGAPFTLAAYLIEGGASRDYRRVKSLMYNDTGAWDALMGRLARACHAAVERPNRRRRATGAVVRQLGGLPGRTTTGVTSCLTFAR